MKRLLLLVAAALVANNTNAQWQTNVPDKVSALNSSMAYTRHIQYPASGDKQSMDRKSVAVPATSSNVYSRSSKHTGGVSRSAVFLFDSIINWNLNTTTMMWDNISKQIDFVYDAYNNELSYVVQNWTGSSWVDSLQYSYTYAPNTALYTNELIKSWNGTAWVNYVQYNLTYTNNLATTLVDQTWNGTSWVNASQAISTYNSGGAKTSEIDQSWNGSTWVDSTQETDTYNANNGQTGALFQNWNGSAWVNTQQYIYTLNSNNDQTGQLLQSWSGSAWVNESQFTDSLNSNNLRIRSIEQVWSAGAWVNRSENTNTYNSSNKLTSELSQTWTNGAWVNSELYSLTYNASNDVINSLFQNWNSTTSAWVNLEQVSYTYDANNNETSFTILAYDNTGNTIIVGDSIHWYYNAGVSGVAAINDNATIRLYPNPTQNFIHTDVELKQMGSLQLSLVNLLGQIVWTADAGNVANYHGDITVADLPDGIYLLEVITNIGIQSRQVAVIH